MQFGLLNPGLMQYMARQQRPGGTWAPPAPVMPAPEEQQPTASPLARLAPPSAPQQPGGTWKDAAAGAASVPTGFGSSWYRPAANGQGPTVFGLDPATLFAIGGAFMNDNASMGQAMTGISQALQQQGDRRYQNEERAYMRGEREYQQAERNRLRELRRTEAAKARAGGNEPLAQAIEAASEDQVAQIMAGQLPTPALKQDQAQFDERIKFETEQNRLNRENQIREASVRARAIQDPMQRIQYQTDFRRLMSQSDAALLATNTALPRLQRAEQIIDRLTQLGAQGAPIDARTRIDLNRLAGRNPEARGLLEELQRIQTLSTVDIAQKLAPVSNTDFGRLMEINPQGNMSPQAAKNIVRSMRSELSRGVASYTRASRWFDSYGGLTATLDPQGRTFEQVEMGLQDQPGQQPGVAPGSTTPQHTQPQRPPRVGEERDGYIYRGGDPSNQGSWAPTQRTMQQKGAQFGRQVSDFFGQFQQQASYPGENPPYPARSGRTWVRRPDGRWYEINSDSPEARRRR